MSSEASNTGYTLEEVARAAAVDSVTVLKWLQSNEVPVRPEEVKGEFQFSAVDLGVIRCHATAMRAVRTAVAPGKGMPSIPATAASLPDWTDVYRGLSEQEIADIEKIILDRSHVLGPTD